GPAPASFGQPEYEPRGRSEGGGRRRKITPLAAIGIVVACCAVAGLGAGALLSGGDDGKDSGKKNEAGQNPGADTGGKSGDGDGNGNGNGDKKPDDPALPQAKALDALLKDSNNSRDAVINSVESIKSCKKLDKAAADLHGAAGQRNGLVERLEKMPLDKLPGQAALKAQLKKAWQSSAAADNHYAAWAGKVGSKHGCKKGKASTTPELGHANKASGDATAAKKQAATLWNSIATKYGLTPHQYTQL
ncbi:hypothetical protein ACFU99_39510, partial [Streptomyces sp. NPDC057654]